MAARWAGWGLTLADAPAGRASSGRPTRSRCARPGRPASGIEIAHTQRLAGRPDGRIRVEETVEVPAAIEDLARVGTVLELAAGHEAFEWFGRGPHETYPDRRAAAGSAAGARP